MKKIFVMLSLGLLITGAASAQDVVKSDKKARFENRENRENGENRKVQHEGNRERKNPEEIATRQTEMLNKKLNLSDKQKRKVQEISLTRAQQTEALRNQYAAAPEQDRSRRAGGHQEMKAVNDRWESELKDILSKKQYTQYEASRQEMKNRRLAGDNAKGEREGRRKEFKRQPRENG